jgi:hypothetical protein
MSIDAGEVFGAAVLRILTQRGFVETSRIESESAPGLLLTFSNRRFLIRLTWDYHGASMSAGIRGRSDHFYEMQTVLRYLFGWDRGGPAPVLEVAQQFDEGYERVLRLFERNRDSNLQALRDNIIAANETWYAREWPPKADGTAQ